MTDVPREAAAATGAILAARAIGVDTPFICDRPFLFVIQDRQTLTPLMMGKVLNPSAKEATGS